MPRRLQYIQEQYCVENNGFLCVGKESLSSSCTPEDDNDAKDDDDYAMAMTTTTKTGEKHNETHPIWIERPCSQCTLYSLLVERLQLVIQSDQVLCEEVRKILLACILYRKDLRVSSCVIMLSDRTKLLLLGACLLGSIGTL